MEVAMQKLIILAFVFLSIVLINAPLQAGGGSPGAMASDFTKIKLTILQETISSDEDLTVLEPGLYEFIVANKTSEKELFEIQDMKTEKTLGKIKVKPNKFKKTRVKITENGFRYRKSDDIWHDIEVK